MHCLLELGSSHQAQLCEQPDLSVLHSWGSFEKEAVITMPNVNWQKTYFGQVLALNALGFHVTHICNNVYQPECMEFSPSTYRQTDWLYQLCMEFCLSTYRQIDQLNQLCMEFCLHNGQIDQTSMYGILYTDRWTNFTDYVWNFVSITDIWTDLTDYAWNFVKQIDQTSMLGILPIYRQMDQIKPVCLKFLSWQTYRWIDQRILAMWLHTNS